MYGVYSNYGDYGVPSMMGYIGGGIMTLLFWIAIIAFIVWVVKEMRGKHMRSDDNALSILKERYAKGEIDRKEFEEKKKDLS